MKRRNFFKSLATFIAAPSIIENVNIEDVTIDFDKTATDFNIPSTQKFNWYENKDTLSNPVSSPCAKSLIKDLSLLTPQFYKQYQEKYGNEQYSLWVENLNK